MIEQKKNDWLATLFFSPDKTPQDLANLGITTDNSSLQDKDYYKNIPQIQEAFKNESGNFDNVKFDKYYQGVLQLYNDTDNAKLGSTATDFYSYDPYDYFAPLGSKQRDIAPKIVQFANPERRRSRGLTNLRETSAPTMSLREVAQQNKVYNVETQKFEDWTPNEWGGLSAITRPALVLAQWDEDGEHKVGNRIVSHKKGDYKFNEYGDPYYETLGNRSLTGKDILHITDTLTVDGSKWNKYDFFDADGLDKSAAGTIARTVFKVAPMFLPYVGKVYGGLTATIELGKLLPVLYKSIEGIASGDISTSRSAQTATDIQAWFSKFDTSVSDKGRQSYWTLENIGRLIEDSSMQLFQQRVIGEIPKWFNKAGEISENTAKWGRGLSLAYMAGTSSTQAYDDFKQAGADDRVAGLGMISVMGAMFGLMNNDYFKDFWFKDTYLDRTKVRSVVKEAAKTITEKEFAAATLKQISTPKGAAKWVMNMQKAITNRISKIKPGDLLYDSLNEGLEESIEEVTTDAVKAFYSGLNTLGIIENDTKYDFGITPSDMVSRYITSFIGGGIGGAVFSLHNRFEMRNNPILNKSIEDGGDGFKQMIYLLRQGKESELRKELDRLHNAGKLASTNLSGTEFEIVKDGDRNTLQYKAAEIGNSQNDLIYRQLNYYIDRINEIIKEEGLDISDGELQFITEQANISGQTIEQTRENYLAQRRALAQKTITEKIIDSGLYSQLFEDWNDLTAQIVQTKVELEELLTPAEDQPKTPKDIEARIAAMRNNSEYQRLRVKIDNLRAQRNAIINGEKNDFYTGQLLFAARPQLVNNFTSGFGIHNFTRYKYNKDYNTLTPDEKTKIDSEYQIYTNSEEKAKVLSAYDIFTKMQEQMIPIVIDVAQKAKDSSSIYLPGATQYKELYERISDKLNEKRASLNEVIDSLPEGVTTNEEIDKLRLQIQVLENYLKQAQNFKFGILNPALSTQGKSVLARPNGEVDTMLAFENYAMSYKDYLNYIKDNGLYLDLVDSDLASILQGWITVNGLTNNTVPLWISRVQEIMTTEFSQDLDAHDPFVTGLSNALSNIVSNVKNNNIDAAIQAYEDIDRSDLKDQEEFLDIKLMDVVNKLLPGFGTDSFIDYLNNVKYLKSQISSSPAYDLIDAASKIAGGNNWEIVDLIKSEQTNFLNSKNVEDYIIRDKNSLMRLKETKQLIDAISAILDASVEGGYNSQINTFRKQLEKDLLPIISVDADINIVQDLNRIATQLQSLIDISERNQSQKLREQKDIAINMRQKFINLLTSNESLIKDKFAVEFGINLEQLREDLHIPTEVTEENYKELEEAAIKLETAIFTAVDQSKLTSSEIAEKLISLFNPEDLLKGKPTKLSKDPNTTITDYDQLIYLASIIATPSQNFYSELKEIITQSDFTNAPIFSQEYAVRVGYSQISNKEIFNSIILQLKQLAERTSSDQYIQTKSPLSNMLTIYGGAGVGKTKGVAYLLKLMMPKAKFVTSAPTRKQTNNLSESIQHDGNSLTKNELIEKILGRPIQESDIKSIGDVAITSDINLNVSTDNIFGDSDTKILFIDEISWYNRIELELISKWARKNNISIVALGDYKQNAAFVMHDNNRIESGIEDTFVVKTPDLIAPLRPDNIAKYDNYTRLAEALDKVYEQYYNNPSINTKTLNTFTQEYLKANKIVFKYFEDEVIFGGEKIVPQDTILQYVDKLKRISDDIAIITDRPDRYNTVKGVKVVPLNSVQGDEFDYVIIDKNFGLDDAGKGRGDYYKLKDLYTLSQRSRKGTIISNSGLGDTFESRLDTTSAGNIEMPQSQVDDFKNWRSSLIDNISSEHIPWEPKESPIVQPVEEEKPSVEAAETQPIKVESPKVEPKQTEVPANEITTNPVGQVEFSPEEPAPVVVANEIAEPVKVEPIKRSDIAIPATSPFEVISTAESYIDFMRNDVIKYYKTSEYSFQKYLQIGNPEDIKKLTNLLRSYFVYGYYKTSTPKLAARSNKAKSKLEQLVRSINPKAVSKVRNLMNQSYKFMIVPYNQKGLLVARIGEVDIPLLITDPQIGEYNGDIELASKFKYEHIAEGEDLSPIDVSDFRSSPINIDKLFQVYTEPVILSASNEDLFLFEESQREWVYSNNGRTFFLVSNDPFLDANDFREFLDPVVLENQITWTTQHNDAIALIGMNWVTDFETILKVAKTHSKNKNAQSIINGSRAGQIIGIAYKVDPSIVTARIKNYFKNKNETSVVRIGSDIVSDINLVDDTLAKYQGQDIDITFGYIREGKGFVTELKGEWSINRVFENRRDMNNFNQAQLSEINRLCKASPKFKQGIYARDIRTGDINGVYRSTELGHSYITNIKSLIGNDFKIDSSKINVSADKTIDTKVLDRLNTQLAELGLDRVISDQSNIQSTIDDINNQLLSEVKTPEFEILTLDGDNIMTQKVHDFKPMIANELNIPLDSINISDENISEFIPFYVSLQDQTSNYVVEKKDGEWSIREFPIMNEYMELRSFVNANNNLIRFNREVSRYIKDLLNNKEIDMLTAESYYNVVSIDSRFAQTQQQVDKYLMSKLMNNEC